jgi:hypothetical protein
VVEFHHNSFTGYRDINGPQDLQLGRAYPGDFPTQPAAQTAAGVSLEDTLAQVQAAYPDLRLVGADRWQTRNGLNFVDDSPRSPAPPKAKIVEIRTGTCGSY